MKKIKMSLRKRLVRDLKFAVCDTKTHKKVNLVRNLSLDNTLTIVEADPRQSVVSAASTTTAKPNRASIEVKSASTTTKRNRVAMNRYEENDGENVWEIEQTTIIINCLKKRKENETLLFQSRQDNWQKNEMKKKRQTKKRTVQWSFLKLRENFK